MFIRKTSNVAVPVIRTFAKYAQKASITFLLHHKLIETTEPFVQKNLTCIRI